MNAYQQTCIKQIHSHTHTLSCKHIFYIQIDPHLCWVFIAGFYFFLLLLPLFVFGQQSKNAIQQKKFKLMQVFYFIIILMVFCCRCCLAKMIQKTKKIFVFALGFWYVKILFLSYLIVMGERQTKPYVHVCCFPIWFYI